jgi:D-proline reductase (dithiol) PrdB
MPERTTLLQKLANRFFAIPAIAQLWAKRSSQRTALLLDPSAPIPFVQLKKPLATCRVALVTTGGIHLQDDIPFDMQNPDGDASYREIPSSIPLEQITITHKYYDHTDADQDINVIFPLQHFRDLVQRSVIGDLAPRHFGFMGHLEGAPLQHLIQQTAAEVAAKLREDGVDFAFLTPA